MSVLHDHQRDFARNREIGRGRGRERKERGREGKRKGLTEFRFNTPIISGTELNLPNIEVNQAHFVWIEGWRDSRIIREMKAISPPGVIISVEEPVQIYVCGDGE